MERLTIRVDNGLEEIYFYNPDDPEGEYTLSDIAKDGHDDICDQIANRLAAYEDTGLTPKQIEDMKKCLKRYDDDRIAAQQECGSVCEDAIEMHQQIKAQQQEINLLNMEIAELREQNQALKDYAENIEADKDEQARKTRQLEEGLRSILKVLETLNHRGGLGLDIHKWLRDEMQTVNALLGGKEDA